MNHLALSQYPNMNCIDVTGSGHMSEGEESDEPEIELHAEGTLEEEDTEEISPLELEEVRTEEVLPQGVGVESPVMTTPPKVKPVKSSRNPSGQDGPWYDEYEIPRIKKFDIGHQRRRNRPKLSPGKHVEPVSIDGVKDRGTKSVKVLRHVFSGLANVATAIFVLSLVSVCIPLGEARRVREKSPVIPEQRDFPGFQSPFSGIRVTDRSEGGIADWLSENWPVFLIFGINHKFFRNQLDFLWFSGGPSVVRSARDSVTGVGHFIS
ncbi:MAG: hypothetical protein GY696_34850, partial [Gammaproteobacteria bacterium]|nr:hypothetical protein [Gammaproteobacteria bacterium]